MTEEDEAFNDIERQAKQRKESVRAAMLKVEDKWIETNNSVCALLRQAHDVLAMSSFPPKRKWVGLTDEDKHEIELRAGITEDDDGYIVSQVFKLTEAKLKEKNT